MMSAISDRLKQGPFSGGDVGEEPNLPSGGTSGYHPVQERRRGILGGMSRAGREPQRPAPKRNQSAANQQAGYQSGGYQAAGYQSGGYQPTGYQPAGYQPTGYQPAGYQPTGYQPTGYQPTGYQPTGYQPTGYQPTGYQPAGYQPTGYQPTGYQPTGYQPNGYPSGGTENPAATMSRKPVQMGSGYQGAFTQGPEPAYQQTFPPREEKPYEQKWQQGAAPQAEDRNRRFGRAEEVPHFGQQSVPNNVSYMPNVFVGDNGVGYRHVERLTQPVSASTCYRLIEFMRNGESVIVNTELIQDERENQRCLDLLYGAAYTMNCSFTRIAAKSIYLIAPASVTVISYESIRQMNEQDQAVRWPGNDSAMLGGGRPKRAPVFGAAQAAQ